MSRNPLISVIMSTYNETEHELTKCIQSILAQSYANFEFIIINDNPANNTISSIISQYEDKRIIYIINNKNQGLPCSLNIAINKAHGEYIARMDADDISLPDRLKLQLEFLIDNNLDMIGSDIQIINEKDEVVQNRRRFPITDKKIRQLIKYGGCLAHPTWLVRKIVFEEMNGYRQIHSCEDYDFIIRTLNSNKFTLGNLPQICLKYRLRQGSISQRNVAYQYIMRNFLSDNINNISDLSEDDIDNYVNSTAFQTEVDTFSRYLVNKNEIRNNLSVKLLFELLTNNYTYKKIKENFYMNMH